MLNSRAYRRINKSEIKREKKREWEKQIVKTLFFLSLEILIVPMNFWSSKLRAIAPLLKAALYSPLIIGLWFIDIGFWGLSDPVLENRISIRFPLGLLILINLGSCILITGENRESVFGLLRMLTSKAVWLWSNMELVVTTYNEKKMTLYIGRESSKVGLHF